MAEVDGPGGDSGEQYKVAFSSMVQTEKVQFAEQSCFAAREQEVEEEEGAVENDSLVGSLNSESEDEKGRGWRSQSSEQDV